MPSTTEQDPLSSRIEALEKEIVSLRNDVGQDEAARKRVLGISHQMTGIFEAPAEAIWRQLMQPHVNAAIRVAIELGLFEALNQSERPMTADEMAKQTSGEKLLIGVRILRPLAALHFIHETGFETYVPAPVSKAFSSRSLTGGFKFMHDEGTLSCVKLPTFVSNTSYRNPLGPQGNFQYSHSTDLSLFPWLMTHKPQQLPNFFAMLEGWREGRTEWFDIYPVPECLLTGAKAHEGEDTAFYVDVAGANGYDIQQFHQRFASQLPGRLVLEDLPPVINSISPPLPQGITGLNYDFFTPQPIRGARAYYMRSICHDWSDERAAALLKNSVEAMGPGYSRLLINDWVIPDTGSPLLPALLDLQMMAMLSGIERTETQWKGLLGGLGLEIVKFWSVGVEVEWLIECVRKG